ncbi:MAG: 30S ribosomal protein S20, partial [Agriterribacter sp.]
MPNIKSAIKRVKVSEKRRARNASQKSALRTAVKSFETVAANISNQNDLHTFYDGYLPNNVSKLYYRVKATQPGGAILYSNILTLYKQQEAGFKLNSIIASAGQVITQINADVSGAARLTISTADGKTVYQQQIMLQKGSQVYSISHSKQPSGINIISVVQNGMIVSRQFVNH